jgi:beta-lactamase class A
MTPPLERSTPASGARPRAAALVVLALLVPACTPPTMSGGPAPSGSAADLEQAIRALAADFDGQAGVYARHLETGVEVAVAADELYPTASMVKVPLLVGLWEAVTAGRLDMEARLPYHDSLFYESDGDLINKLRPGEQVSLWQLAVQMIVLSDNTASLWIQALVGGANVNEWLATHDFEHTRVNSRVDGRRGDWERYGWGQSTPREMARLLVMIRHGEAGSEAASDAMFRLLSRSHWPKGATSVLPAGVNVAAKPGAVSASRSEVLLVNAPAGDYVLCIMTREQADRRWTDDNEGDELIRSVSALVYDAFGSAR